MGLEKYDQERVFADRENLALIENQKTSILLEDRRILQELQLFSLVWYKNHNLTK